MYKEDLAFNNPQWLIYHKTQPNSIKIRSWTPRTETKSQMRRLEKEYRQHLGHLTACVAWWRKGKWCDMEMWWDYSGQNHHTRHRAKKRKTKRQREEKVGKQYPGMDKPVLRRDVIDGGWLPESHQGCLYSTIQLGVKVMIMMMIIKTFF